MLLGSSAQWAASYSTCNVVVRTNDNLNMNTLEIKMNGFLITLRYHVERNQPKFPTMYCTESQLSDYPPRLRLKTRPRLGVLVSTVGDYCSVQRGRKLLLPRHAVQSQEQKHKEGDRQFKRAGVQSAARQRPLMMPLPAAMVVAVKAKKRAQTANKKAEQEGVDLKPRRFRSLHNRRMIQPLM